MISLIDKALLIELYLLPDAKYATRSISESRSVDRLLAVGLISPGLAVTEKGKVLCEALRAVGEPVQQWVMPS